MRLLIVEDDTDIREFLKTGFEAEMFSVDVAVDGEQASRMVRNTPYNLVILDNILPIKSGEQICREMRESGNNAAIIMLSARSGTPQKVSSLNMGADDYVTKPFSFAELLARVKAVLRRPNIIEDETLSFEGVTLDVNKYQMLLDDQEIYLTRKEFALLELLMRNKGAVLSRSKIIEHVWDASADPFSNTIETHVLNLRKKIDLPGRQKLIHTVPGKGYKLDTKK